MLELELDGALYVQEKVPGACTIFIAADVEELERRLRERATESTGEIERPDHDRPPPARAGAPVPVHGAKRRRRLGPAEVLAAIVERELALAATIVPR